MGRALWQALARSAIGASALLCLQALAQPSGDPPRRGSHVWIERPWDFRYVVVVQPYDFFQRAQARAARLNRSAPPGAFRWEEFFDAIRLHGSSDNARGLGDLSITKIEFDRDGTVRSPNRHSQPLRGRINRLRAVVLSAGDEPSDRVFDLGEWFIGIGDASTHFAPSICDSSEMKDPAGVGDGSSYRYGPRFTHPELTGTFGCREWAFQLYEPDRPYIDVTSHVLKRGSPPDAFIRSFVGFARFGDSKPVIGRQGDTWFCLLECPGGDQPGRIENVAAWARARGWPTPRPPTRAPTFPDPPARSGTYP